MGWGEGQQGWSSYPDPEGLGDGLRVEATNPPPTQGLTDSQWEQGKRKSSCDSYG